MKRKLILKCFLSPGDIVLLTAAVRDLHRCYPGRFVTDVRTPYPELWKYNPHLCRLSERDPEVEVIDCENFSLINHANEGPYHAIHGFIQHLSQRLRLYIRPTDFKGDIHLSRLEKSWSSQVHERVGCEIPFWIITAGGKHDCTIKWWDTPRYQAVVNHFRGRIQFVQVGAAGHHHPRLEGVIDLRGQTTLRELVRLVHHAQGVLCPVTSLMHLAAAVETRRGRPQQRPCVVIAGGREPAHWEAYPGHQFIHTNGALPCCAHGGCWRSRTVPLGDGETFDHSSHLCVDVVKSLPRCMDLITPEEVIRRIELYFHNGEVRYLSSTEYRAAQPAVNQRPRYTYDEVLTPYTARRASETFIEQIPPCPDTFAGRGIVICGGGMKYFPPAWVCIHTLRRFGCTLPIQLWHLGEREMDDEMRALLAPLGVQCIDAEQVRQQQPMRILRGYELKAFALVHSPFREVLLLDADNMPLVNPEFLFETPQFKRTGAIFWPDLRRCKRNQPIWRIAGLSFRPGPEFESGQIVLDKQRCWKPLALALWYNEHSDFYFRHILGDKETFHLAFRKLGVPFAMPGRPVKALQSTMCQHDFKGRRIFQHRNLDKWNIWLLNRRVKGFRLERECRELVKSLQSKWSGGLDAHRRLPGAQSVRRNGKAATSSPRIFAVMITCSVRERLFRQTLQDLARTDWNQKPVIIQSRSRRLSDPTDDGLSNTYRALERGWKSGDDYVLFLEDDLRFNRFLRHNLLNWAPLHHAEITLASLYNPGFGFLTPCDVKNRCYAVPPGIVLGSQAFLLSRQTVKFVLAHWNEAEGGQDLRIARLAARLSHPILYHPPSLVQHVGTRTVCTTPFHCAPDFSRWWKAPQLLAAPD